MFHSIEVALSTEQQYAFSVGRDMQGQVSGFLQDHYPSDKIFLIIDEKVHKLHGQTIRAWCSGHFEEVTALTVPQGEKSKSVGQWNKLVDGLLNEGIERSTPVLVAGGGVTGDLGGFAAASALRGVPLIHLPTTLLAMVDSSIGGKTGINHPSGKNLIGDFYQPDAIFADVDFLQTLEQSEWANGLSEIIKYAAISKSRLFDDIDNSIQSGFSPDERWAGLIHESAKIKIDIVEQDALESGVRAYLNFGHTFGHALEKMAGYGTITHGQAVLIGMIAATYFSEKIGGRVSPEKFEPYLNLHDFQFNDNIAVGDLIDAMRSDKKVKQGTLRLVLLEEWGRPFIQDCNDLSLLKESWSYALSKI